MKTHDFFSEWLEDEKLNLERSTYEAYTIYFNRHIIPFFEERCKYLSDITARDVKDYINHLRVGGRLDGKKGGMSHASIKKHLSLIKQSLNEAVICGYIPNNPALSVKLRRSKSQSCSDNIVMMTIDEAQRLISAFQGHILYPIVLIALYYGLRRSEVIGLRWSAIDFERNEMRIEHTVVKNLTIEAKDSTKTDLSRATFELIPEVRKVLLELKEKRPANTEYIFVWEDGRSIRPDYVTKAFRNHLKNCGLPKMRFHDLRHSTASILFDRGMSLEDVKNWLRHSDIETTSNIYLHYSRGRQKLVLNTISGIFKI